MGAASNARWIAVSQAGRVISQLVGVAILARLLSPADYGVMAMAGVVITLAGILRDMGTGSAIVQAAQLEDRTTTAVFWFNVGMSTAIGLIVAGSATLIAAGFRSTALIPVLWALAAVFPIGGLGIAHQALLERQSQFALLARIELASVTLALLAAIAAALMGAGVYSLVLQTVMSALLTSVQLWFVSRWRPGLSTRWSDLASLMHFSGNLAGFNLINFISRNADSMIIGRYLGTVAVGSYSVAYKLMLFPLQNLTVVLSRALFPVMSRHQTDLPRISGLYLRSLRVLAMITAPLMAGAFVLREPLVAHLFGPKWSQAAAILAWLAPTGFVQSIVSTVGTVFMARGRTDVLLRLGIIGALLLVAGFVIGVQTGVEGVAMWYFIANVLNAIPCAYALAKQLELGAGAFLAVLAPACGSAAFMLLVLFAVLQLQPAWLGGSVGGFVLDCGLGALVYALCLKLVFRQDLRDLRKLVRPE